jgi:putative DNA primase/helicase
MFEEDRIWRAIQELNGLDTLEGATLNKPGKVIRVSKGLCESVSGLARARFRDKAAFAKAHSGFAAPSGFWACNSQEGWFERDPTPEDRCRLYVNVDPKISNDPPPVWTSILKRMWGHEPDYEQRVRFLHEWIGAMLAGTATKFQTCPILVGEGKNGKSVIIDIISALIPDQLRSNVSPSDLENNRFTSSLLVGKVLNVVAEIPATELMSSAIIKAVIDGSEILGERKNQDGFSLRCIAANLFSCNKLPPTRDISYGFFRRFAPLTCTAPEISEEERDMSIAQRVIATEHGAILGMAMQAYQDMLVDGRGYTQVPSVQAARHAWRGESDSVQMWVEEECERGGPTEIRALYDAYRKFANDTGSRAVSLGNFAHRLSALGYPPNGKSAKGDRQRDLRVRTQTSFASSSWTSSGWRSH